MTEQFNLSADEAIEQARREVELHEAEPRPQLVGMDADTAFEMGYRSCLYDLDRWRGGDPFEVDLVTYDFEKKDSE